MPRVRVPPESMSTRWLIEDGETMSAPLMLKDVPPPPSVAITPLNCADVVTVSGTVEAVTAPATSVAVVARTLEPVRIVVVPPLLMKLPREALLPL